MKKQFNLYISEDLVNRLRDRGIENFSDLFTFVMTRWLKYTELKERKVIDKILEDIDIFVLFRNAIKKVREGEVNGR